MKTINLKNFGNDVFEGLKKAVESVDGHIKLARFCTVADALYILNICERVNDNSDYFPNGKVKTLLNLEEIINDALGEQCSEPYTDEYIVIKNDIANLRSVAVGLDDDCVFIDTSSLDIDADKFAKLLEIYLEKGSLEQGIYILVDGTWIKK